MKSFQVHVTYEVTPGEAIWQTYNASDLPKAMEIATRQAGSPRAKHIEVCVTLYEIHRITKGE